MDLHNAPTLDALSPKIDRLFDLAGWKIADIDRSWNRADGTPVFTIKGRYTSRGWTEWTQGFQYGCAILLFDATGEKSMLELGRSRTVERMAPHVSHIGVHDHGFNNVSTYGNLRRLMREGRIAGDEWQRRFYEMALKASGAVQAARWTPTHGGGGFVHSFNGPHSLFSDTIRSMRSLVLAWQLGHVLMGENDEPINLLHRSIAHGLSTAKYNIYYGEGRDIYDTPAEAGRVVHESIFNTTDGRYRCPSTQQGYSPFSTWTRGLAWILCGFAEQLEFLAAMRPDVSDMGITLDEVIGVYRRAAEATAQWYLRHSFTDGMVYWDAGAPGIPRDIVYEAGPSNPYNDHEPIDASAAAIAAQGFWRLGRLLDDETYDQAARVIASTLFSEPYLSTDREHQGLILHANYHCPRGWDYVPKGRRVPCGESCLWGDYHAMEIALLLKRAAGGGPHATFFDPPADLNSLQKTP
ncbi:MAG: glycosyl hydrolase [Planctomycetes bacterium]|nr:glycosyl hydrolase [Planctomycetota bacterium]